MKDGVGRIKAELRHCYVKSRDRQEMRVNRSILGDFIADVVVLTAHTDRFIVIGTDGIANVSCSLEEV